MGGGGSGRGGGGRQGGGGGQGGCEWRSKVFVKIKKKKFEGGGGLIDAVLTSTHNLCFRAKIRTLYILL